jgi:uncharacterized protein (DUF302 family)
LSIFTFFLSTSTALLAEIIDKPSPHSVDITMTKLIDAINSAGATVFATIDHSGGAAAVGQSLAPAKLLVFGNPVLGTPAMQANIIAGLDLPLRVLVYADKSGETRLAYHNPSRLAADHHLPMDSPYIKKMRIALDRLTTRAIAED